MATGLTAAWQGMQAVTGDRTMPKLKKAFGTYNAYEDPKFYQDWEMFEQNPNPQRAKLILDEYGDSLEIEDQAQLYQMIQPDESTLQGAQYAANKDLANLKGNEAKSLLENDYGELSAQNKITNAELGIKQNKYNLDKTAFMQEKQPFKSDINASMSANERSMAQDNLAIEKAELALENDLPLFQVEAEIANLDAQKAAALYEKLWNERKYDSADKLWNLFMRTQKANTQTAESNATITGNRADISTATKDDEIQMVKDDRVLSSLEKELGLYSQPYKKQNVVYNSNLKGNQSAMSDNELWQSNQKTDFLKGLGDNELMTAMGLTKNGEETAEEAIDIKYTIPNPYNDEPLASNQRGIVVNRRTGEPFIDEYGQYYMAGKSQYSDNIQIVPYGGNSYGGNSETKNVLTTTPQPDFNTEPETPWYEGALETLKNYISGDNGDNESQQSMSVEQVIQTYREQNPDLSYQEMADRMEQNIDPETFKQQTGQNLNAVIGRLRMMR